MTNVTQVCGYLVACSGWLFGLLLIHYCPRAKKSGRHPHLLRAQQIVDLRLVFDAYSGRPGEHLVRRRREVHAGWV